MLRDISRCHVTVTGNTSRLCSGPDCQREFSPLSAHHAPNKGCIDAGKACGRNALERDYSIPATTK